MALRVRPSTATLLALLGVPLILAGCAGPGVHPPPSTAGVTAEPAVNTTSASPATTVPAAVPDPPAPTTTAAPEPPTTAPESPTTIVVGGGPVMEPPPPTLPDGTSTTTTEAVPTTVTTAAPSPTLPLPTSARVERIAWSGTMELTAVQEDGSVGTTSGLVTGSHVGPDRHRAEYAEESRLIAPDGAIVAERTMEWAVGVVNDRAWFDPDGEVEEMELDQALRFMPFLSSATGAVIPGEAVLADLAGRPATDIMFIGRRGKSFSVPDASVELYAPLFLRYTPALYGTEGSGTEADVEVVIDVETGALLVGALEMVGTTASSGDFEVEVLFEAIAIDERWIHVLIPG